MKKGNLCPYYDRFSSPTAIFDAGEECIGADCNYWYQNSRDQGCEIEEQEKGGQVMKIMVEGKQYKVVPDDRWHGCIGLPFFREGKHVGVIWEEAAEIRCDPVVFDNMTKSKGRIVPDISIQDYNLCLELDGKTYIMKPTTAWVVMVDAGFDSILIGGIPVGAVDREFLHCHPDAVRFFEDNTTENKLPAAWDGLVTIKKQGPNPKYEIGSFAVWSGCTTKSAEGHKLKRYKKVNDFTWAKELNSGWLRAELKKPGMKGKITDFNPQYILKIERKEIEDD